MQSFIGCVQNCSSRSIHQLSQHSNEPLQYQQHIMCDCYAPSEFALCVIVWGGFLPTEANGTALQLMATTYCTRGCLVCVWSRQTARAVQICGLLPMCMCAHHVHMCVCVCVCVCVRARSRVQVCVQVCCIYLPVQSLCAWLNNYDCECLQLIHSPIQ